MKHSIHIAACFAGLLVWNTGVCAENAVTETNPYLEITKHNIFYLNPPQVVVTHAPPVEPSSRITVNGATSILDGAPLVLFEVVSPATPPTPSEKSYCLREGQQQDDIEVMHVDFEANAVTFKNHGVIQKIPLARALRHTAPVIVVTPPIIVHPGRLSTASYLGG